MKFILSWRQQDGISNCIHAYRVLSLLLTHQSQVKQLCVSKPDHHWFRWWFLTYSAPCHYLPQCWIIVYWTTMEHISMKIQPMPHKKIELVCKSEVLLYRPQHVKCPMLLVGLWSCTIQSGVREKNISWHVCKADNKSFPQSIYLATLGYSSHYRDANSLEK